MYPQCTRGLNGMAQKTGIRTIGLLCTRIDRLISKYRVQLDARLTPEQKVCLEALAAAVQCFVVLVSADYDIGT